jgi:hypothetical protein
MVVVVARGAGRDPLHRVVSDVELADQRRKATLMIVAAAMVATLPT